MYLDSVNQNEYPDAGVIGSFNISTGATPTLTPTATATATVAPTTSRTPETGISDGGGAIIIGLFVMLFGGILYKYSNNNYSIKHE